MLLAQTNTKPCQAQRKEQKYIGIMRMDVMKGFILIPPPSPSGRVISSRTTTQHHTQEHTPLTNTKRKKVATGVSDAVLNVVKHSNTNTQKTSPMEKNKTTKKIVLKNFTGMTLHIPCDHQHLSLILLRLTPTQHSTQHHHLSHACRGEVDCIEGVSGGDPQCTPCLTHP